MTLDELRRDVAEGRIDTVLLGITDMQGRLMGKRMAANHFLEEVATHGAEACNYLLAVDVEMNTVDGYALTSWDKGYGDFVLTPDFDTLMPVPWQEGTALVLADLEGVAPSPRQILRRQLERLAERGWGALAATELEFIVFRDSYEQARDLGYRGLTPANQYNVDYSLLGTARVEPLLRRIRLAMEEAGMPVEDSKGECNLGQHEINFRYADALTTADRHTVFKNGAKEIAAGEGMAITFMAKVNEREGSSCHVHLSLQDGVFASDEQVFSQFLAGQLAAVPELMLFLAPNVNSYKRFAKGSFAPTAIAWGHDNRTCAFRVVGHGPAKRIECRLAGADVNPYLALAALIAAGLDGVDRGLDPGPPLEGNAYASDAPQVPATLREAHDRWLLGPARDFFGDEVADHYANMARVELEAFDSAVTDWERFRGFERL
jgi:glutamine synthetase